MLKKLSGLIVLASAVTLIPNCAVGDEIGHSSDAKLAWAAFECTYYASVNKQDVESERLFQLGYRAIISFLDAVESGKISSDEADSEVPSGILFLISGPSKDFVAGRIFETVSEYSSDEISKKDSSGNLIIDPSKWNTDEEIMSLIAGNKYRNKNCALLK